MKILVTGAGGLLGGELARGFPLRGHEVTALARDGLDITDATAVRRVFGALRPDAVVNCAGYTRVDPAQADQAGALAVNRDGARNLAEAATEVGATLAHVSTDYVFGGDENRRVPYRTDDAPDPVQRYGDTKLAGEKAVLAAGDRHLVVRVSWLFGGDRSGFVAPVVRAAREGRHLRLVSDSVSRPTWSRTVEEVLEALLRVGAHGVWHACDGGETTRLEQGREALRVAGVHAEVEPVTRAELWPEVPRPAYSVLDLSATEALLGRAMPDWRETIDEYLSGFDPS
jgi:dTDP-4-dehydrorhamnose reductase